MTSFNTMTINQALLLTSQFINYPYSLNHDNGDVAVYDIDDGTILWEISRKGTVTFVI